MRDRAADRRLMRYLHGELPAEQVRQLRAELARDPALQARLAELHRLWQGLQPSAPTPAPFGYVPKLQRLAEQQRSTSATSVLGWAAAPACARALAVAALVAGVALGVGLGRMPSAASSTTAVAGGSTAPVPPPTAPAPPTASVPAGESVRAAASATVEPGPAVKATPGAPAAAEPGQREAERDAPGASEPGDAMLTDETASFAGSTTLAEEYMLALEGSDDEGGGAGGGEGDAGW